MSEHHQPTWSERAFGSPAVFAVTYASLAGGLYLLLGPVAGAALGATPAVMLVAGVLFALAVLTFVEGTSLHAERGGSPTLARHAFDELWSFVAAWALLLDALLLTAAATLAATNYLEAFWPATNRGGVELAVAGAILATITVRTIRGHAPRRLGRLSALVTVDLAIQVAVVVIAIVLLSNPGSLTEGLELGTSPSWDGVLFGLGAAMVVVTGLESSSGLAGELHIGRAGLKRLAIAMPVAMLVVYPAMAVAGLMALPVQDGTTELAGRWIDAPVLGIVDQLDHGSLRDVLRIVVGVAASLTLAGMALAAMGSASRIASHMALHRQLPTRVGRLHPQWGTPWLVIAASAAIAAGLVALRDMDALVGTMAFGAMLATTIAHASVVRLRFTEPDLDRPFRMPLNVRFRDRWVPVPALVGGILSALVLVSIVISHEEARTVGLAWMAIGVVSYVAYRRSRHLPVRGRVAVPEQALRQETGELPVYGSILVPLAGSALDDDVVQTAGRLAGAAGGEDDPELEEGYAVIEAVWVHVLPVAVALDGPLPDDRRDEAKQALARAKAVGEEYDGVRVATSAIRARALGKAIVDEAVRRGCQAIVMVAPPPVARRGARIGASLGARGGRGEVIGDAARYVIEHAPCQVILTAPALDETAEVLRRREAAKAQADERLDDDDEQWLDQL
ncbi:universal stress protein [Patulibacter brassicae]|uniref:Universal stress protein n=1 Tax=Patulibacter brassicae TaxID=1705717 RepID=A0ABU4VFF7_9ACTN|nr:universal stress protein [Patulibacter brassicae]MDX8150534.1 universal stress protein [Patulibacter brassicae]